MRRKLTNDEYIDRAKNVNGEKYDYSLTKYVNSQTKVCVLCKEHGAFYTMPFNHLKGHGCRKCANNIISNNKKLTTKEFIEKAKEKHGDKYDYSKVEYNGALEKIHIICHEHGEFTQRPNDHLNGCGCPKCGEKTVWDKRGRITTEEFIEKAKAVHGDKYNYSKVRYANKRTKVCIICPEHGEFWQTPGRHLMSDGCPICNESKLEIEMSQLLKKYNVNFEKEKRFSWLKDKGDMRIDFYLPDYNIGIECQGVQHYRPTVFGGSDDKYYLFKEQIRRDKLKKELCNKNNIKIMYFTTNYLLKKYVKECDDYIINIKEELKKWVN